MSDWLISADRGVFDHSLIVWVLGTLTLGCQGASSFFGRTARPEVMFSAVSSRPFADLPALLSSFCFM